MAAYVACQECGAAVVDSEADEHVCDPSRWLDYQIVRLRPNIARFETDLRAWLLSPVGTFEVFYAETHRA